MYQNNKQLSVLDMACGRGGDIMKFYYAMSAFYVGIDVDREGLVSAVDGALSRYNQHKTKHPNFPKMYFMQGDVSAELNLESQKNALNVRRLENEDSFKKFFSNNPSERTLFDIINCQFAIHYMLRNNDSWTNFKSNINNYLRNGGMFLATTFDAEKITKLLGDNESFIQEYTDDNGKVQNLFEIRKKYDKVDKNTVIGTGNAIDVYISWFSQEGRFLTEYLVDSRYVVKNLKDECNLDLIDTDNFENQLVIHEPYLNVYAKYEEVDETRKFLGNVGEFYRTNSVNDGCKLWNGLFRYYVFRKQPSKKQKGGDSESGNMIDFSDSDKFSVPVMKGYDNDYSCVNSIHHVLRSHKIIPKYVTPDKMCSDLGISFMKDNDIDSKLEQFCKKIVIEHVVNYDDKHKDTETEKVIDGLNIFVVERDCNDAYDIDLIKKNKKISPNDTAVILMKEGTWYIPVYFVNQETQKRVGLYDMTHPVIQKMMDEI